jgi:PAS domain S-box-containing protein
LLFESARDFAIFSIDRDRRITSWNPGAEAMFGYPQPEILDQAGDVLFTPEDLAEGAHLREVELARERGRAENERWHVRKDGSLFYGSGSLMPLRDNAGQLHGYVKILRDLTEQKSAQEALQSHMDELARFNAVAVGREARMIELKREINDLCAELGRPPRYSFESSGEDEDGGK